MDVKKIAARIAAVPAQQVWAAMRPSFQTVYEAVWYVEGDEDDLIVLGGTEAELKALAKQGGFSVRIKQAVPFEALKNAVSGS